jgi:hypothetical protein
MQANVALPDLHEPNGRPIRWASREGGDPMTDLSKKVQSTADSSSDDRRGCRLGMTTAIRVDLNQ